MKKSLLALTLLGAFTSAAFAQSSTPASNISIYGIVDLGFNFEKGTESRTALGSGNQSGSRLGFKGTEDLGGGLSAIFQLENGFNADAGTLAQGSRVFGRRATVGLSGEFGELNLGRRNTPYYNAIDGVDPMNVGFAGNASNLIEKTGSLADLSGVRMENSVFYTSPVLMNSLKAELAWGLGEVAGNNAAFRQFGGSLNYSQDAFTIVLAHHNAKDALGDKNRKNTILTGKYAMPSLTLHIAFAGNRKDDSYKSDDILLGVSVPLQDGHKLMASYIRKNDKSALNADAKQAALAYTYDISKRTNFYASYAKISNDTGANYKTNSNVGNREANFGIRHKF